MATLPAVIADQESAPKPAHPPALTVLLLLAIVFALKVAEDFALPVVLAVLMSFVLAPMVRALRQLRLPSPLAAGIVLAAVLATLSWGVFKLAQPAAEWVARAPQEMRRLETLLAPLVKPVERVQEATEQVERIAGVAPDADAVEVKDSRIGWRLVARSGSFLVSLAAVVMLLFFLLASGDFFLHKLIRVLPSHDSRAGAVEIARQVEDEVSKYLFTISAINVGLGVALGTVFALLGLPNPLLWGALATSVAFIPYLGHWLGIAAVGAAGLLTLGDSSKVLIAIGAYAAAAFLEGNFLTPLLLGRRMLLNPVAVFVGLLFWTWVWGIPGAFLAVPILATLKILSDHLPQWSTLGEFLGR